MLQHAVQTTGGLQRTHWATLLHTWRDTAAGSLHQSQPPQLAPLGSASPKCASSCARRQRSDTQYCTTFASRRWLPRHPC